MAWQQYLLMKGNLREVQRVPCTLCAESPQTAFLSVENVVLLLSSKQKTKVCTDLMFIFFCFVLKFALEEYCCNQLDFYTQTPCGEPQLWAARLFLRRGFNSALLWSDEEHPHWFFASLFKLFPQTCLPAHWVHMWNHAVFELLNVISVINYKTYSFHSVSPCFM